jgi:hypothetical protein
MATFTTTAVRPSNPTQFGINCEIRLFAQNNIHYLCLASSICRELYLILDEIRNFPAVGVGGEGRWGKVPDVCFVFPKRPLSVTFSQDSSRMTARGTHGGEYVTAHLDSPLLARRTLVFIPAADCNSLRTLRHRME